MRNFLVEFSSTDDVRQVEVTATDKLAAVMYVLERHCVVADQVMKPASMVLRMGKLSCYHEWDTLAISVFECVDQPNEEETAQP